jgi:hypothetical protein
LESLQYYFKGADQVAPMEQLCHEQYPWTEYLYAAEKLAVDTDFNRGKAIDYVNGVSNCVVVDFSKKAFLPVIIFLYFCLFVYLSVVSPFYFLSVFHHLLYCLSVILSLSLSLSLSLYYCCLSNTGLTFFIFFVFLLKFKLDIH